MERLGGTVPYAPGHNKVTVGSSRWESTRFGSGRPQVRFLLDRLHAAITGLA
jgi:hypothetical protein